MKHKLIGLFIFFIFISVFGDLFAKEIRIGSKELEKWGFFGKGFVVADSQQEQLVLSELPGSKGVMLVSPDSYRTDIVVSYKIRPLTPESVLVIMLSASDRGENNRITFPDGYDGNIQYLMSEIDSYFIAFHNAAHNRTPFIRRCPQEPSNNTEFVSAELNIMTTEWYDVEAGRKADRIWLKIDNEIIIEATDKQMLDEGHIIFRMRGT